MKLSSRKQLLSEADAELKRMQKLAGILKEDTNINEYGDGTKVPYVRGGTTIISSEADLPPEDEAETAQSVLKKQGIKSEIIGINRSSWELRIASKDLDKATKALLAAHFGLFDSTPEDEWNEM